jgi:hypothetical protein
MSAPPELAQEWSYRDTMTLEAFVPIITKQPYDPYASIEEKKKLSWYTGAYLRLDIKGNDTALL